MAISPDGSRIAYRSLAGGAVHLHLRPTNQLEGTRLFSAATNFANPFFSPDGGWVGFSTFDDQTLKKVSILGGPPETLFSSSTAPRGASWGEDGTIIFAINTPNTGLFKGSAGGGDSEVLTTPDAGQGELAHWWPQILPGGKAVLFNIVKENTENMQIAVLDLVTGERKILLPNGSNPHYAPTGHIVYGVDGSLLAVPFDSQRLELTGDPVPVLKGVMNDQGRVSFDLSANGSLVYVAGAPRSGAVRSLAWIYRDGREQALSAEPLEQPFIVSFNSADHTYDVSPDGKRFLMLKDAGGEKTPPAEIILVQNWFEELKRLVPTK